MNKQQYLAALKEGLHRLPKEETDSILEYYEEYFSEAGEENEVDVIEELGDPKEVARRMITELAIKYMNEPVKTVKGGFKSIQITILAICAAPIALPLIFAAVITVAALAFAAIMVYLAFGLATVAIAAYGVVGIVAAVIVTFSNITSGIAILGTSLVALGAGLLFCLATVKFGSWAFRKIPLLFKGSLKRRKA